MQGDSPCADVEVAKSGGYWKLGRGSRGGIAVVDVVECRCQGSRT
jgi:hypothetical protein